MKPLSLAEAQKIVGALKDEGEVDERNKEIKGFLKKFLKIDIKEAEALKKDLEELKLMKLKEAHIVKIIDVMPEDSSDLSKILSDISLDEDEVTKVLEVVKKHK